MSIKVNHNNNLYLYTFLETPITRSCCLSSYLCAVSELIFRKEESSCHPVLEVFNQIEILSFIVDKKEDYSRCRIPKEKTSKNPSKAAK